MKTLSFVLLTSFLLNFPLYNKYISSRADRNFEKEYYPKAIKLYSKLAQSDSTNTHAFTRLADSYRLVNDFQNAELWYEKVVNREDANTISLYHYAEMLKYNNKHQQALLWMEKYQLKEKNDIRAQRHLSINFFRELLEMESINVNLKYLDMNSDFTEFGAAFLSKNQVVFSSSRHGARFFDRKNPRDNQPFYNLYIAELEQGEFTNITAFAPELTSAVHEGPVCFTPDCKEIFFTRNVYLKPSRHHERTNRLMILHATLEDGKWANITVLPFNSEEYSCGHPAISADGKKLFFVSDMPGGFGHSDIYYVDRNGDAWGEPVNLGETINTPGKEMFPFLYSDGTLYFSSDGYATFGGLDIFAAKPSQKGFEKPVNLGTPINSIADDFAYVLAENGYSGYLSSNRRQSTIDDIYYFNFLPKAPQAMPDLVNTYRFTEKVEVIPLQNDLPGDGKKLSITEFTVNTNSGGRVSLNPENQTLTYFPAEGFWGMDTVFYTVCDDLTIHQGCSKSYIVFNVRDSYYGLKGLVVMKGTEEPVEGVKVTLLDANMNPIADQATNKEGTFQLDLLKDRNFFVNLEKRGFASKTVPVSTINVPEGTQGLKELIEIEKLEGLTFELFILFDLGKWNIRPDAARELDEKAVTFLTQNPDVTIELSAHTDSRGNARSNMTLSQRRAESAVNYLISKGIDPSRMVAKGYGQERLLNNCVPGVKCSEEEHQRNRRVEISVTSY